VVVYKAVLFQKKKSPRQWQGFWARLKSNRFQSGFENANHVA